MMCVNQCVSLSLGSPISNVARSYSLCVQRESVAVPVLSSPIRKSQMPSFLFVGSNFIRKVLMSFNQNIM